MTNQQGAPEAPKGTASDGKTELFNVPGYPLMVRAVDFNRLHAENVRLSGLCDKWNSECDEFREDNKRLAALIETQQPAPSAAPAVPTWAALHYAWKKVGADVAGLHWGAFTHAVHYAPSDVAASPTPQADSQPAPVLDYPPAPTTDRYSRTGNINDAGWYGIHDMRAYVDADRAASAPADSVMAPAAGAVAGPTLDVQAKIDSNTRDHFGDILPTLKAISRGDWYWGANSRCKYIEIRLDTRDGGCILYDPERVRISPEQFAHQAGGGCGKMEPWPATNAIPPSSAKGVAHG